MNSPLRAGAGAAAIIAAVACAPDARDETTREGEREPDRIAVAERALGETLDRATALADSIEDLLRPVPLLRPAEEAALRRHPNATHVARARALGVRATDEAAIERLREEGRLVPLGDSTEHWVVQRLGGFGGLVTPDARALVIEIAERFQDELEERGLPPYRLEVTSALRTPARQAALRRTNPNAAAGVSAHEFGTTLDISYFAFAPPARIPPAAIADAPPLALLPHLERAAALALESVSARKSRELQAILGHVLRALQSEGAVLVTLERLQPVYHITVARRFESP